MVESSITVDIFTCVYAGDDNSEANTGKTEKFNAQQTSNISSSSNGFQQSSIGLYFSVHSMDNIGQLTRAGLMEGCLPPVDTNLAHR